MLWNVNRGPQAAGNMYAGACWVVTWRDNTCSFIMKRYSLCSYVYYMQTVAVSCWNKGFDVWTGRPLKAITWIKLIILIFKYFRNSFINKWMKFEWDCRVVEAFWQAYLRHKNLPLCGALANLLKSMWVCIENGDPNLS